MDKHKPIYILLGLLAPLCLLASCAEEEPVYAPSADGGRVILSYAVGGSPVTTRAQDTTPEDGITSRGENLVSTLDLFIFRDGVLVGGKPLSFSPSYEDSQDGSYELLETGLRPDDFQDGDQVCLLANCHDIVGGVTTLQDLQDAVATGLVCYDRQEDGFVMDGTVTVAASMRSGNDLHIRVDLKRAAAKVRLSFAGNTDWDEVEYRFCHYATTATVLEREESAERAYVNTLTLSDYPSATTLTNATPIAEDSKQCLVLYAYPNDWYSGPGYPADNDHPDGDHLNVAAPIDPDRETRILLKAPYDGELYYYDIPVNFRLPENNDDLDITFDDYKDLYRLQRNHIYDITVTIDGPGGTESEPVTPKLYYQVMPFDEETVNIPAFE